MIRKEKPLRKITKGLEFGNGGMEYKSDKPGQPIKPIPGKPKPKKEERRFTIMAKRMNDPNGFYNN